MRKGASSLMNFASVSGSVFSVGTTNSVKAIFAAVSGEENANMRRKIVDGDLRTALDM
jgi:cystathionine beta-lyase family protein involved in aluminum resistance